MERHEFHAACEWRGNSDGDGVLHFDRDDALAYGVPASTGGKPGRSNPEELLVAAVVSCYSITLALLLERKRLPAVSLSIAATGVLERQPDKTLKFVSMELRPQWNAAGLDDAQQATLLDIAHRAERYCLVSNALRGSVTITIVPRLSCVS